MVPSCISKSWIHQYYFTWFAKTWGKGKPVGQFGSDSAERGYTDMPGAQIDNVQWGKKVFDPKADFVRLPTDKEMIRL